MVRSGYFERSEQPVTGAASPLLNGPSPSLRNMGSFSRNTQPVRVSLRPVRGCRFTSFVATYPSCNNTTTALLRCRARYLFGQAGSTRASEVDRPRVRHARLQQRLQCPTNSTALDPERMQQFRESTRYWLAVELDRCNFPRKPAKGTHTGSGNGPPDHAL